ncbi:ammonium transporter [Gluconobacter cerinus]|uniref:ammonium transporter n=1 Tax=Gluconobacter TaxID=441 RepID=UPI000A3A4373|nr:MULTISPECIES: ammonium transporter [Gluconobacter]MBS1018527.1 ammonium transporter [Gluconobacter cerinus]MBS1030437.1 ammonium transporter [Gluconobacter cerinus]MBS1036322.1 ammonium transporter [Gluconobacter cerinus]MBS1071616.1 ammonium transporter [Gluconobacter cerinus]MCW2265663.1 Amt family ammonium transporter [Gluconobacter cerinus]
MRRSGLSIMAAGALLPVSAMAADAPAAIDTGDTAWMLISTALVLMMTVPGLALFYGGMVRKKNVLATLIQSFAICCIASLVWMVAGYSLAFSNGTPWIGDLSRALLNGVAANFHNGVDSAFTLGAGTAAAVPMTIPESVYMMFQMTFAVITPALITGAYAERMKFSSMCVFTIFWLLLVYAPVAHWVWSPTGWVAGLGAVDFAGGTVVHINSGVAGLVCAYVLGKRRGIGTDDMSPFNLTYAIIGASLLWVGWFGFNAGSALGANGRAGMAMLTTQLAAAAGGVAWMAVEWARTGKPTALGIISGVVAGLVAITPAAGFVLPGGAVVIGLIAGAVCFWSATWLKHALGYDDSLDAFGVHGTGGIIGALLTGVLAYGPLSATDANPSGTVGSLSQLLAQAEAVCVTIVWCVIMTFVILKVLDRVMGLRVSAEEELEGLDTTMHGERIN